MTQNTPAKELKTPAAHIPGKADYRIDQIRRYMRRHAGFAVFINETVEVKMLLADVFAGGLTRAEIKQFFNNARKVGMNQ